MLPSRVVSLSRLLAGLLALLALAWPAAAQETEKRIALVIGNAAYADGALPTTANDAGLIAQQLQAAGFDVSGARDLGGDALRSAFRDFVDKARQSGPDTVAFVYFAGYGLQFEGENYVIPVDAKIPTAADVPIQAVRIADLMRPLAELPLKARIVVIDAARENPFAKEGQPLASGLALVDPDPGALIAFNAAPGTVAPPEQGDYGAYARALAEMMREGGVPLQDVFDQVRLRVGDLTKGALVPWDADRVDASFAFFDRAPDAPTPPPNAGLSTLRDRPLRDIGAEEAYQAALTRDTVSAYQEFLDAYPNDPMGKRVRAILAARREALTWARTLSIGTSEAYWSYLRRYPQGPHAADCHRRLLRLASAIVPPPDFQEVAYDVAPPPPDETVIVDQPVLTFADLDLPPPPPVIVLAPEPSYFVDLPPPPPPVDVFVLPIPVYEPLPIWVDRPTYVAPPPVNIIAYNIHNTVIVNSVQNTVIVKDPAGRIVPPLANAAAAGVLPREAAPRLGGVGGGGPQAAPEPKPGAPRNAPIAGAALGAGAAAALHVALPPSVAARAQQERRPGAAAPGQQAVRPLPGQALPGQQPAQPLPGQQAERPLPGQALPGQQPPMPLPGQAERPLPGQALPGQQPPKPLPGQAARPLPGQALPGQQPPMPLPGQAERPLPGQAVPGQQPPMRLPGQAERPLPGQAVPGQQPPKPLPGQAERPLPGQAVPGQQPPKPLPGERAERPLPGQALPGQIAPLPEKARPGQPGIPPRVPGQATQAPQPGQAQPGRPPGAPAERLGQPEAKPGQAAPLAPGQARPGASQQQMQMQREQQMQAQQRQQQMQREQQMQAQQRQQQMQREQQMQAQQRQQQMQREQQMQAQQRQQQMQREQQMQAQQRQQQMQREQQMQAQQRQQQMQREQQMQAQQRQQQMQREQQMQAQKPPGACGKPGQPPCK